MPFVTLIGIRAQAIEDGFTGSLNRLNSEIKITMMSKIMNGRNKQIT